MATYFGTPEMQSENLQTLYLMNPNYVGVGVGVGVGYPDSQSPASMLLLNSNNNHLNLSNQPHQSHQSHHFAGIPLYGPPPVPQQDPTRPLIDNHPDIAAVHGFFPRLHTNLWSPTDAPPTAGNHHQPTGDNCDGIAINNAQLDLSRPAVTPQHGLSLSLTPQHTSFLKNRPEPEMLAAATVLPGGGDELRISGSSSAASSSVSAISSEFSGLKSVLMGSKYLKVAQELLDDIVSVGKDLNCGLEKVSKVEIKGNRDSPAVETTGGGESRSKRVGEITVTERQDLQMKKAKLVSMLDELEQKYREYHHQMQMVISWFEGVAGKGSAKTYTAVALRTISKQFRCLRDAIVGQIRETGHSLGEEESGGGGGGGSGGGGGGEGSKLRFVEQHLRQQRALQQLGMMQQSPWRPQRGLPERAVSVLRAWLFEHFLHPYPKDSDKVMLAKQTGLTRSQVSNWFINARVRLWKPMIEEMYLEETKGQEHNNGSDNKKGKSETNEEGSKPVASQENCLGREKPDIKNIEPKVPPHSQSNSPSTVASTNIVNSQSQAYFSSFGSPQMLSNFNNNNEVMEEASPKKAKTVERRQNSIINIAPPNNGNMEVDGTEGKEVYINFGGDRATRDGYSLITSNVGEGGHFGAYSIGEMQRLNPRQLGSSPFSGNGVSLTLGLQHCENIPLPGRQNTYIPSQNMPLGRNLEIGNEATDFFSINTSSVAHSAGAYDSIHLQNRKQFSAHQLLPDFVA